MSGRFRRDSPGERFRKICRRPTIKTIRYIQRMPRVTFPDLRSHLCITISVHPLESPVSPCSSDSYFVDNMVVFLLPIQSCIITLTTSFPGPRPPGHPLRNRKARVRHLHIALWPKVRSIRTHHYSITPRPKKTTGTEPPLTSAASAQDAL